MKTKLKYLIVMVLIIVAFEYIKVRAAESINLSLSGTEKINSGNNITLKITGNNIAEQESKIAGIKLDVFYDTDIFEFVSAKKLDAASNSFDLYENYPEEGRVRIGLVSMGGINKNGDLYEVIFKSKDNINKTDSELRLESKEIIDSNDNDIPAKTNNITIKFNNINEENKKDQIVEENRQEEPKQEEFSQTVEEITQNTSMENNNKNEVIENQNNNIIKINKNDNKNIRDIIQNSFADINTNSNLRYEVEKSEILDIDNAGNIIAKETGTTNVKIIETDGIEKTIPIEIIVDDSLNNNNLEKNNNRIYIIIAIIILIVVILIIIKKTLNKKKI